MKEYDIDRVTLIDHPVAARELTRLRNKETGIGEFRSALQTITTVLACEVTRDLALKPVKIQTPVQQTGGHELGREVIVVPILRSGLAMYESFIRLMPEARVGHMGMYRDEKTLEPVEYYSNLPTGITRARVFVVDPMLATGGTAVAALARLKEKGAREIDLVTVIAAPEGVGRLQDEHPDVQLYTVSIDEKLNDNAFIVPGLGDAGDRYFGTI